MKIPYGVRPGGGFLLLALVGVLSLCFFGWGFATPRLDRIWRLSIELRVGRKKPLDLRDLRLMQQALCDHPKLAEDFLEGRTTALISANRGGLVENGHAYLIRARGHRTLGVMVSVPGGGKKERTLEVRARTVEDQLEGTARAGEPFSWTPPQPGRCATLIEVRGSKGLFSVGPKP